MNRKFGVIALLVAVLVGGGIVALRGFPASDPVMACTQGSAMATADMPLDLAAMLEPACAKAWFEAEPDLAEGRAVVLGYPSLLLPLAEQADALALISQVVAQGDRGFFANDPAILPLLSDPQTAALTSAERLFVAAVHDPDQAYAQAGDKTEVLQSLPIWDDPANRQRLIDWCADAQCTSVTACQAPDGPRLGLADKLRIAQGQMDPQAALALCGATPDWIVALRRAGVVDTGCTSSLQVNAIMAGTLDPNGPCLSPDRGLMDYPAVSDADGVRHLRLLAKSNRLKDLDEASAQYIGAYFPKAADYLSAPGKEE
jgi:hypothetical protein